MSHRPNHRDSGALSLSYLIIVPVFLLALMAITQTAMWYLARSAALAAARQGVDAARVQPVSLVAGRKAAKHFARTSAAGYLIHPHATSVETGNTIVVTVTGGVPSLVLNYPITVSEVAEAPVERFTTP
jgi:Flp pilus assembly protein TadG